MLLPITTPSSFIHEGEAQIQASIEYAYGISIPFNSDIGVQSPPFRAAVLYRPSTTTATEVAIAELSSDVSQKRASPHEVTHLTLRVRIGDQNEGLPAWLNERLSTLQELYPPPQYRLTPEQMQLQDSLIPISALYSSCPGTTHDSLLAHAQSDSLPQHIRDIYGIAGIIALLDAYQEGTTCKGGIQHVLRRSIDQLELERIAYTFPQADPLSILRQNWPSNGLAFLFLALMALGRESASIWFGAPAPCQNPPQTGSGGGPA